MQTIEIYYANDRRADGRNPNGSYVDLAPGKGGPEDTKREDTKR
jgi:hypothetical protein